MLAGVFEEFGQGKRVTRAGTFPRIPYAEAIAKYGSDKPDLRNPLLLQDERARRRIRCVRPHPRGGGQRGVGRASAGRWQPCFCDKMNGWAQSERNPGLGYIFWREGEEGGTGPVAKNIGAQRANAIREQLRLKLPATRSSSSREIQVPSLR